VGGKNLPLYWSARGPEHHRQDEFLVGDESRSEISEGHGTEKQVLKNCKREAEKKAGGGVRRGEGKGSASHADRKKLNGCFTAKCTTRGASMGQKRKKTILKKKTLPSLCCRRFNETNV